MSGMCNGMGICFVTMFFFIMKTSSQPMIESCRRHVGICFDPMKFDRMLRFLVKACDAMVKINYLSNNFEFKNIFPNNHLLPQMNFFSSLDLWKSSREEGGSWDAFFVQLIVTFPIKLPKE
jgi:hypothetical protein